MATQTFEAQAAAVRTALRRSPDNEALREAEKVLNGLAALRKKCMAGPGEMSDQEFSDQLCAEILELLHLPTGE